MSAADDAYAAGTACLGDPTDWDRDRVKQCAEEAATAAGVAFCAEYGPIVASTCGTVAAELAGPIVALMFSVADFFGAGDDAAERARQSANWDRWDDYDRAVSIGNVAASFAIASVVEGVNGARTENGRMPQPTDVILRGLQPLAISGAMLGEHAGFIDVYTGDVTPWRMPCRDAPYKGPDGRWVSSGQVSAGCVTNSIWAPDAKDVLERQAKWMAKFRNAAVRELVVRTATLAAELAAELEGKDVSLDELERLDPRRPKLKAAPRRPGLRGVPAVAGRGVAADVARDVAAQGASCLLTVVAMCALAAFAILLF